mgnify:CR=1 FL=1
MTIRELIAQLKTMDQDMMVVKARWQPNWNEYHYETMDGHWFQTTLIRPSSNVANEGRYYEASEQDENKIEALYL